MEISAICNAAYMIRDIQCASNFPEKLYAHWISHVALCTRIISRSSSCCQSTCFFSTRTNRSLAIAPTYRRAASNDVFCGQEPPDRRRKNYVSFSLPPNLLEISECAVLKLYMWRQSSLELRWQYCVIQTSVNTFININSSSINVFVYTNRTTCMHI